MTFSKMQFQMKNIRKISLIMGGEMCIKVVNKMQSDKYISLFRVLFSNYGITLFDTIINVSNIHIGMTTANSC